MYCVQGEPDIHPRACHKEILQPLTDELIQQSLAVGPWEYHGKPVWHRLLDWAVGEGETLLPCVWLTAILPQ